MTAPRMFPIMGGPAIPWVLIAPHARQAERNHGGQTLERLAQRGGLSPCEAVAVLEDRDWFDMAAGAGLRRLNQIIDASLQLKLDAANARGAHLEAILNTPEIADFAKAVDLEAAHQRARWGEAHDANKTDEEFLWLIGYLAGKACHTPIRKDLQERATFDEQHDEVTFTISSSALREKQLHRIITIAAAAANWHRLRSEART